MLPIVYIRLRSRDSFRAGVYERNARSTTWFSAVIVSAEYRFNLVFLCETIFFYYIYWRSLYVNKTDYKHIWCSYISLEDTNHNLEEVADGVTVFL